MFGPMHAWRRHVLVDHHIDRYCFAADDGALQGALVAMREYPCDGSEAVVRQRGGARHLDELEEKL